MAQNNRTPDQLRDKFHLSIKGTKVEKTAIQTKKKCHKIVRNFTQSSKKNDNFSIFAKKNRIRATKTIFSELLFQLHSTANLEQMGKKIERNAVEVEIKIYY